MSKRKLPINHPDCFYRICETCRKRLAEVHFHPSGICNWCWDDEQEFIEGVVLVCFVSICVVIVATFICYWAY